MTTTTRLLVLAALSVAGCNGAPPPAAAVVEDKARPTGLERSPGKPSAPVTLRYRVLGTPLVGQPVAVEIELASEETDRPLALSYAVTDAESLLFAAEQPRRIELSIPDAEGTARRQVTVVPQREGRLFLTVTAEVETASGAMLRSMAIPLSVGRDAAAPEVNGELELGPDGEAVISMPAREQ